jgi:hypothetical protein
MNFIDADAAVPQSARHTAAEPDLLTVAVPPPRRRGRPRKWQPATPVTPPEPPPRETADEPTLGSEMLREAEEIAEAWLGDRSKQSVGAVYRAARPELPAEIRMPAVRVGRRLIIRRSVLRAWWEAQERRAAR